MNMVWLTKIRRTILMAGRNLWLHKLRSFLSVLGIIIGTGAVITLMAFGEGSMQDALEDIKRQGLTNVVVMSVKPPDDATSQRRSFIANYGLLDEDHRRFGETLQSTLLAHLASYQSMLEGTAQALRAYSQLGLLAEAERQSSA